MKPFLLRLKERFTTYKLNNVMKLRSIYSIRIYELLKQYQSIGKRTITIESLRKMLGIEPDEYKTYNNLKRKVIMVAHKEVNEKTDICFDYKEIKLSRKVNEIEFIVQKKAAATQWQCKEEERQRTEKRRNREDRKKVLRRQRIDEYLTQLSPVDLAALTAEADALARQEGKNLFVNREVPEQIVKSYLDILVEKKLRGDSRNG